MKCCSLKFFPYRVALALLALIASSSVAMAQATKIDFEKQIWPFLNKSCVKCHKAPFEEDGKIKKPKAELRLDGAWAILAGSENGAVLTPGKAEESELWIRCDLPEDDDDYMPPTDKADPLTDEQKDLLAKWINEGSEFGGWVGNLEGKPEDVSNTGIEIPESEIQTVYNELAKDLSPLKEDAWASVTAAGGRVMPLSGESSLLSVDFRLIGEEADDADVAMVKAIGDHVAHLDFSKTAVTDVALEVVGSTPRLVRLDLHKTGIGDAALKNLKGLEHLRYLNLYGTQVGDAGLNQLQGLKSLRNVYIWQSKATEQGVKKLQKALPDAKIIFK
jgi:hypothetical protein